MAEICCHNLRCIHTAVVVGKQIISVVVQRQACQHNGTLNPKIHRTDQHPHIPQLCLVLTAGCAPNAKTNLRDVNCQYRN